MNDMTTIDRTQREYSRRREGRAGAQAAALHQRRMGRFSSGGATIDVEDPSTGKIISSFVEATDKDTDRAVAAARTAFDDGRWRNLPPIVREKTMHAHRRPDRRPCGRTGRAGSDRRGQAQGHGPCGGRARCRRALPLYGGLGREDRRRSAGSLCHAQWHDVRLYPEGAGRRLRADRAVELPAADGLPQARPGAGCGLHHACSSPPNRPASPRCGWPI